MSRDTLYEKLKQYNVYTRRYFYPIICDYACYRTVSVKDPLTVARRVPKYILTLPIYESPELTDVEAICEIIKFFDYRRDNSPHRLLSKPRTIGRTFDA